MKLAEEQSAEVLVQQVPLLSGWKPGKSQVAEADWLNLNYRCAAIITGAVYVQSQACCGTCFFLGWN